MLIINMYKVMENERITMIIYGYNMYKVMENERIAMIIYGYNMYKVMENERITMIIYGYNMYKVMEDERIIMIIYGNNNDCGFVELAFDRNSLHLITIAGKNVKYIVVFVLLCFL